MNELTIYSVLQDTAQMNKEYHKGPYEELCKLLKMCFAWLEMILFMRED